MSEKKTQSQTAMHLEDDATSIHTNSVISISPLLSADDSFSDSFRRRGALPLDCDILHSIPHPLTQPPSSCGEVSASSVAKQVKTSEGLEETKPP